MKLGKRDASYDHRDLLFEHYRAPKLPRRPRTWGHEQIGKPWGMLGNDKWGDCVWAGACHETMLWTAEVGLPAPFSEVTALMDYSAVTGFNADDASTDQGTDVRAALEFRRTEGIRDVHGKRHKLGAYVALEPGNLNHVLEALYLFGAVGIGIQFPTSAFAQFDAHKPWSVVAGATVDGGHYVPLVAERRRLECVTWGRLQEITTAFLAKYCDEAWALVSPEMLKAGKSLEGFDLAQLNADLEAL